MRRGLSQRRAPRGLAPSWLCGFERRAHPEDGLVVVGPPDDLQAALPALLLVATELEGHADNVAAARALGIETVQVGEDPFVAVAELDSILSRRGV